jgi:hypothetical protein
MTNVDKLFDKLLIETEKAEIGWKDFLLLHEKLLKKIMKPIINQATKNRKTFVSRDFTEDTRDGHADRAIFAYGRATKDKQDLKHELLSYRKSKMMLEPTFLPVYVDHGVNKMLWFGFRFSKTGMLEFEIAFDNEKTLEEYISVNAE